MSFAMGLRCIGQDLERRSIRCFDIHFENNEYTVYGGYQAPPAQTPVTIRYTLTDVADLDDAGAENQGKPMPPKEFLNQAQILRSVGGFIDKNEGRLIRVTNNEDHGDEPWVKFEYLTREREFVETERTGTALYDMCIAMYKQRRRMTVTGDRYSRLRR
jgi:hypothetical protein